MYLHNVIILFEIQKLILLYLTVFSYFQIDSYFLINRLVLYHRYYGTVKERLTSDINSQIHNCSLRNFNYVIALILCSEFTGQINALQASFSLYRETLRKF
jgi:hypothetical protein